MENIDEPVHLVCVPLLWKYDSKNKNTTAVGPPEYACCYKGKHIYSPITLEEVLKLNSLQSLDCNDVDIYQLIPLPDQGKTLRYNIKDKSRALLPIPTFSQSFIESSLPKSKYKSEFENTFKIMKILRNVANKIKIKETHFHDLTDKNMGKQHHFTMETKVFFIEHDSLKSFRDEAVLSVGGSIDLNVDDKNERRKYYVLYQCGLLMYALKEHARDLSNALDGCVLTSNTSIVKCVEHSYEVMVPMLDDEMHYIRYKEIENEPAKYHAINKFILECNDGVWRLKLDTKEKNLVDIDLIEKYCCFYKEMKSKRDSYEKYDTSTPKDKIMYIHYDLKK